MLSSFFSRLPPFLLPLILINLTGHMALSGGRVTGSLYILQSGHAEYLVGVFMALFSIISVLTALSIGRWVDRVGSTRVMRLGIGLVLVGAWMPVIYLSLPTLLLTALTIGFGFNVLSVASQRGILSQTRRPRSGWRTLAGLRWVIRHRAPLVRLSLAS